MLDGNLVSLIMGGDPLKGVTPHIICGCPVPLPTGHPLGYTGRMGDI